MGFAEIFGNKLAQVSVTILIVKGLNSNQIAKVTIVQNLYTIAVNL